MRAWCAVCVVSVAWLAAGCKDLLIDEPAERTGGCGSDVRTCLGGDCYAQCVCAGGSDGTCARECDAPEVQVADLDESSWDDGWTAFEDEVLDLANQARRERGCCGDDDCYGPAAALHLDARLRKSARSHARDMVEHDFFDHDNREGRTPFDRIREAGFDGCAMGENIAEGQPTPEDVMRDWLDSPGHCANIRSPAFDALGVGYARDTDGVGSPVWVQNFGG